MFLHTEGHWIELPVCHHKLSPGGHEECRTVLPSPDTQHLRTQMVGELVEAKVAESRAAWGWWAWLGRVWAEEQSQARELQDSKLHSWHGVGRSVF